MEDPGAAHFHRGGGWAHRGGTGGGADRLFVQRGPGRGFLPRGKKSHGLKWLVLSVVGKRWYCHVPTCTQKLIQQL